MDYEDRRKYDKTIDIFGGGFRVQTILERNPFLIYRPNKSAPNQWNP